MPRQIVCCRPLVIGSIMAYYTLRPPRSSVELTFWFDFRLADIFFILPRYLRNLEHLCQMMRLGNLQWKGRSCWFQKYLEGQKYQRNDLWSVITLHDQNVLGQHGVKVPVRTGGNVGSELLVVSYDVVCSWRDNSVAVVDLPHCAGECIFIL